MKIIFVFLLFLAGYNASSQSLDYTRKYLKTIVRRQIVEIEQLKAENAKLKKVMEEYRQAESSKVTEFENKSAKIKSDYEKEIYSLKQDLKVKDTDLKDRNREKEAIYNAILEQKKQVDILTSQVVELQMATPKYSPKSHVLPERTSEYKPVRKSYSAPRTTYITGPRGGCYYINSNGNKTYVDRSLCR